MQLKNDKIITKNLDKNQPLKLLHLEIQGAAKILYYKNRENGKKKILVIAIH